MTALADAGEIYLKKYEGVSSQNITRDIFLHAQNVKCNISILDAKRGSGSLSLLER